MGLSVIISPSDVHSQISVKIHSVESYIVTTTRLFEFIIPYQEPFPELTRRGNFDLSSVWGVQRLEVEVEGRASKVNEAVLGNIQY